MPNPSSIEAAYAAARDRYAAFGVDTDSALQALKETPISLQCWQGDDVRGFETVEAGLSTGGIQVTGGYPGRARNVDELRQDITQALCFIPGKHRVNLHAMYGEFGGRRVDRNQILPDHFRGWMEWASAHALSLDFNATCFAHPLAEAGFTLSSDDHGIREFWIEHVQRSRAISSAMGVHQGNPCMHDLWIPDGAKDITVRRFLHREHLRESLDTIFAVRYDEKEMKDAVESKLFGIGSESFVVGSHEFYLGYALTRNVVLCIDMGHYHPTESVADKISALLAFAPELLLHVSRGIRWDSDHVVIVNDDVSALMAEIVRADALQRIAFALDFFDASVNRVGAWVIGARSTLKALLSALLEPLQRLRTYEEEGDFFARLALLEEAKNLPAGDVWEYFCLTENVPTGDSWIEGIRRYGRKVLQERS